MRTSAVARTRTGASDALLGALKPSHCQTLGSPNYQSRVNLNLPPPPDVPTDAQVTGPAGESSLSERRLCRRNRILGEASEGAVEAPSDYDGGRSPPPSLFAEPVPEASPPVEHLVADPAVIGAGWRLAAAQERLQLHRGAGAVGQPAI